MLSVSPVRHVTSDVVARLLWFGGGRESSDANLVAEPPCLGANCRSSAQTAAGVQLRWVALAIVWSPWSVAPSERVSRC